jgi:hypothetical protein
VLCDYSGTEFSLSNLRLFCISVFCSGTDSSFEDASLLDDGNNRNGEGDVGSALSQLGGRQFISEIPQYESVQKVSSPNDS